MRLIDADALKESMGKPKDEIDEKINKVICDFIENAPTVEAVSDESIKEAFETGYKTFEIKVKELFNKYDVLLLHIDGKILPVRNTSKQECYDLLYEIGELIEWRRILWRKNHPLYFGDDVRGDDNG